MRRRLVPLAIGMLLCAAVPAQAQAASLGIEVLSNRADVISAGDALVEVKIPGRRQRLEGQVLRRREGRDERVRAARERPLRGPRDRPVRSARNVLKATAPGAKSASVTVTNHPNGGPVFSGPQVQPWVCQATARDAQCNQPRATSTSTSRRRLSSRATTRRARRRTSRRRRPTRARRSRTSSASRPATRTATSTRSPSFTTRASRSRRGTRRTAGTTSC